MKGTIKSKKDVERLFQTGRRSSSSLMTILVIDKEDNEGRCAFIAGKKLGTAPFRSRCKRVMREVAREIGAPFEGYDVAFIARSKVAHERHDVVVEQARRQLSKLGVL